MLLFVYGSMRTHMGYVEDSYKVCLRSIRIYMAYMLEYIGVRDIYLILTCVQIAPSSLFLRSIALATIISISASTGANLDSAGTQGRQPVARSSAPACADESPADAPALGNETREPA